MNNNDYQAVLDFWFGKISAELAAKDKQKMWYASSAQTDEERAYLNQGGKRFGQ